MSNSHNDFAVLNNEVIPVTDPKLTALRPDLVIYEVIRVMDGKCLFLEDHLARLFNSVNLANQHPDKAWDELPVCLYKLISANSLINGNIRLDLNFEQEKTSISARIIPHLYPSDESYRLGVRAITYITERDNPNAKILNPGLRYKIDSLLKESSAFEAILVNQNGYLTEGSRSNLFFIRRDEICTAPSEGILPGITRDQVIKLIHEKGVKLIEQNILYNEINQFDSAFITGTSPKILPLNSIDNFQFKTQNRLMQELIADYNKRIMEYIQESLIPPV